MGLTCAACHTAQVDYKGRSIRIDGAPALVDHQTFLTQLEAALETTHKDPEKMNRFARKVLEPNWSQGEQDALKARVVAYSGVLNRLVKQNATDLAYGYGRLDAFGKQFVITHAPPLSDLGTDPQMVNNVKVRTADPGTLRPYLPEELKDLPRVPAAAVLGVAVRGVIKKPLDQEGLEGDALKEAALRLSGFRAPAQQSPPLSIVVTSLRGA